jgi:hypothetical protein
MGERRDVRKRRETVRACPSFSFSDFLFKKKKINMGGPARADAQASRAVNSPLFIRT